MGSRAEEEETNGKKKSGRVGAGKERRMRTREIRMMKLRTRKMGVGNRRWMKR